MPADDDPLTSPSFLAINAADSRSYRTRRPGSALSGPHLSPQSGPHSGPHSGPQTGPQYASAPVSPLSPAPVANPYGSYVSPQPVYRDVAPHQDAASYGGYPTGPQSDGSSRYHGAADGYLPAGYPANGQHGNGHAANGNGANGNGYADVDYQNAAFQNGSAAQNAYGPQGHLPGQYDQRGYSTPDPGPVQDGYQGYPGYGAGGR